MELVDGPRPGDVKERTFLTCGMHVHVAVADRHEGIAVLDRVRPWLAVLSALASNSPYWQGRDTGYASYRSIVLGRLPTVGPSPVWGSISVYDRVIREVINTGAAFDAGMVYYDARLSPRHPTIEIRVPDVVPTWLTRSCWLPWPEVWSTSPSVSGTAGCDHSTFRSRRCARRLGGPAATGSRKTCTTRWRTGLAPAWRVVERLREHAGPALEANGDATLVERALGRLRAGHRCRAAARLGDDRRPRRRTDQAGRAADSEPPLGTGCPPGLS